jgi:hypothetical protein
MHMQTHIMAGWCAASLFQLSARERLFCMLAATLPDLDGLSSLFGQEAYWYYHHRLGHNFVFALLLAGALACFSPHHIKSALLYLAIFHLHLYMDYLGSGIGWKIHYLWPFSGWGLKNSSAWDFYSWQNISAAMGLFLWVILIAFYQRRTPLEAIMPSLDRQLVNSLRRRAANPIHR